MAGEVRVGTSGWQYDDWRGTVYPPGVGPGRWLSHYVGWFPTVEVNATFYRLARETAAQRWCDTAPPGFEFAIKGSRYITHQRKLRDVHDAVGRFFAPLVPVLERTAVILWQLPPRFRRNLDRLDRFLDLLPPTHRYAVEFRDDDWFHPDTYALLDAHGVANVWLSSSLTARHAPVATGDFVYLRFHGLSEDAYRHAYTDAELQPWVDRLRETAASGTPAWVYFNNDFQGHAVTDARRLVAMLGDAARTWPPADVAAEASMRVPSPPPRPGSPGSGPGGFA